LYSTIKSEETEALKYRGAVEYLILRLSCDCMFFSLEDVAFSGCRCVRNIILKVC